MYDVPEVIDNIEAAYISPSEIHGHGLFAVNELHPGETLCTLDGQVVPWRLHSAERLSTEWNALPADRLLVRPYRTKYFYINHSRLPNLVIRQDGDALTIVVARTIGRDEEMTLDYRQEPLPREYIEAHGHTYL